jgi:pre-sodorifen synthase
MEAHFPEGANPPLEAIREVAVPLSIASLQDRVSAYSIIAERRGDDARFGGRSD